MKILSNTIELKNNNYNLIRLLAALTVIFAHSFKLFNPYPFKEDPVSPIVHDYLGRLAVYVFFFLSGIYITKSYESSKTKMRFTIMRLFRIWPALIVCIVGTVFILGPLVTTLTLREYFTSSTTWNYLIANATMIKDAAYLLPGVFEHNYNTSEQGAVNGSLWSLPIEIRCYVMVFFVYSFIPAKHRITALIFLFIAVVALWLTHNHYYARLMNGFLGAKSVLFFIAGVLSYIYRKYIYLDYRIVLVLIVATVLTNNLLIIYITLIYTSITVGSSSFLNKFQLPGDYSYGVYIYGGLVQQTICFLIPGLHSYESMLLTFPITIICGVISWYLIEKPALRYAKRLSNSSFSLFRKSGAEPSTAQVVK